MNADLSLFEYPDETSIVQDHSVLSPEYIPPEIVGRDLQKHEISALMKPLFKNGSPDNALIFGPTGSGKTVVTKFVLESLMVKFKLNPHKINIKWIYLQGKKVNTSTSVLYSLIHFIDPSTKVPPTGYSLNRYYDILYSLLNDKNIAIILVIDEIDFIKADDVLYNFSRARSNQELSNGRFISIIGISNSVSFENTLDQRVISSILFTKLRFPSYTPDDILHILSDRVKLAFAPNSIESTTLEMCAIEAAQTEGDARKALNILKTAAELAESEGAKQITTDHIIRAEEKVQVDEMIGSVLELPIQHKIVLTSVVKLVSGGRSAETGEVTKMYEKLCARMHTLYETGDIMVDIKPKDRTTVSKIIRSLELQSIIQFDTVNRGIKGGKTRIISIPNENIDKMKYALYEDDKLEYLKEYSPSTLGV